MAAFSLTPFVKTLLGNASLIAVNPQEQLPIYDSTVVGRYWGRDSEKRSNGDAYVYYFYFTDDGLLLNSLQAHLLNRFTCSSQHARPRRLQTTGSAVPRRVRQRENGEPFSHPQVLRLAPQQQSPDPHPSQCLGGNLLSIWRRCNAAGRGLHSLWISNGSRL